MSSDAGCTLEESQDLPTTSGQRRCILSKLPSRACAPQDYVVLVSDPLQICDLLSHTEAGALMLRLTGTKAPEDLPDRKKASTQEEDEINSIVGRARQRRLQETQTKIADLIVKGRLHLEMFKPLEQSAAGRDRARMGLCRVWPQLHHGSAACPAENARCAAHQWILRHGPIEATAVE